MMKRCNKCREEKSPDLFYRDKRYEDEKALICKQCVLLVKKVYSLANKDKLYIKTKEWRKHNILAVKKHRKTQYWKNREISLLKNKERQNKLYGNDIQFKLQKVLRSRFYYAIKGNQKVGSAVRDLGCSISEYKQYLESKFDSNMTWKNYGFYGWHIDHIKPLSKFDLTDRQQLLEACHYTNTQPLWREQNISKGAKYVID